MLRTLHTRIAAALLVLLVVTGAVSISSTLMTARLHRLEAEQRLNLDLASHIVAMKRDRLLAGDGSVNGEGLVELFHWLMAVNPRLECYLLDQTGRVAAYDPALGELARDRVALAPIDRMLDGPRRLPLLGDDPRSAGRGKIFSVAPLSSEGPPTGYLYIVVDSEEAASVVEGWQASSILRLSVWTGLVYLVLAAIACVVLFHRLTRPLRRLAQRMRLSPESGLKSLDTDRTPSTDEVELLEVAFDGMAQRLREQITQIEHIETVRREAVAHVSHDLRTPLAALRGYLDTLILKNGTLSSAQRSEYLDIAQRHSERLSKLVEELFELSKLESHEAELAREPFSIAELVQDNVQRYQIHASKRGVGLTAELRTGLPLVVADLGLIERVLENLLENALRFTPARGSVRVELDHDPAAGYVIVRVADTGCGIPEAELEHIFERYYKVKRPVQSGGGSGLGLAITKRILDLHDSVITVDSAPGSGTVFAFSLAVAG